MTPTDTDRRLAEIVARQVTPTSIFVHAREDIAFLLSLVEGLSRELLVARSVGAPLGAASGASSAEGSIPSLPCPSSLSSPVPPAAPAGSAHASLSCTPTGSEGGLAIHLEMRPEEEIDLASLAMPPLKEIDPADVSRMRDALSRMRTCPDCTGRATHAGACLTCAGTGFVGLP